MPHLPAAYRERVAHLGSSQAVLDLYRFLNSAVSQQGVLVGEWKSALSDATPERYGRQYVAWWETRNLPMAANIRADFGNLPGARVLMIVGASHTPPRCVSRPPARGADTGRGRTAALSRTD